MCQIARINWSTFGQHSWRSVLALLACGFFFQHSLFGQTLISAGEDEAQPREEAPASDQNLLLNQGDAEGRFDQDDDDNDKYTLGGALWGGQTGRPIFSPAADDGSKPKREWPNISEPGPDMGDFPNSSFTLPKGRAYFEFSPATLFNADRQNPAGYSSPFLFRYGLTDDVEFRVFGSGIASLGGSQPTTGFTPVNLDMKVHLWDDRREWLIPASSLEVYILTTWGSSQFDSRWEPAVNLNFDLPLTKKLNLEWTVGYHGVQQAINLNTGEIFVPKFGFVIPGIHRTLNLNSNQFALQWAFEYQINEKFQVFFHGFHNGAMLYNFGSGEMVGIGGFWKFNSRWMAFGSINSGLTPDLPSVASQIGFAVAL